LFEHDGAFLDQWRVSDDEFQEWPQLGNWQILASVEELAHEHE
jgi:hypothetical protein